ncbi:MAG: glycoside hydrolase family 3 C-terminal domain-containing protein [Syntrophothermus sp.]
MKKTSGIKVPAGDKITTNFILPLIISSFLFFSFNQAYSQKKAEGRISKEDEKKIEKIIASLSLEEKTEMLHSNSLFTSGGITRLGVDELHYDDGPHGIREEVGRHSWTPLNLTTDSATFFPTGSALAATWNPVMALIYGTAIGEEARTRGKEILLGPAINICRTPVNGRTYEYMSEDPLLNSKLVVNYIKGVQNSNVIACVKHFAVNNQETNRGTVSAELDERTLREIYLPAFKAAITEGKAGAIMSAYNKIRGTYCSENDYLLNKVLRGEWGFEGIVVSDWGGTHSTVNAALNGLDVEMGANAKTPFFGEALVNAVKEGKVSEKVVDEKVRRMLRAMFFSRQNSGSKTGTAVSTPEHNEAVYKIAGESIVLLKNSDNLLPLDLGKIKRIAVIGDNATHKHASGGFGAGVKARFEVTPLAGLISKIGSRAEIKFVQGYKPAFRADKSVSYGKLPENKPDQQLIDEAVEAARNADIAIIIGGTNHDVETEATDRTTLALPFGQDELIKAVCSVNPKTIIIIAAGGPVDLTEAMKSSNTLVYSWYNGSQGGWALADVLAGDINPSGKLPFTFPARLEDSPAHYLQTFPGENLTADYKEGILVGYRWYDTKNIKPQFCFGHGLSYTTFDYSDMKVNAESFGQDDKIEVSLKVTNTGLKEGMETVQLYVSDLSPKVLKPAKELKAFTKVKVPSGGEVIVHLTLNVSDLAYFDDKEMKWVVSPGKYKLATASSAEDIREEKEISIQ